MQLQVLKSSANYETVLFKGRQRENVVIIVDTVRSKMQEQDVNFFFPKLPILGLKVS